MKRWPLNRAYFWEAAPFFRILLPLAAGILFYYKTGAQRLPGGCSLTVIFIAFIFYAAIVFGKKNATFFSIGSFALLNAIMFFSGISVSSLSDIRNNKTWFGNSINTGSTYLARVTDMPSEKENSWKVPVTMIRSIKDGKASAITGNAFLYLYKDRLPMPPHKGDSLLLPGNWQPIQNAGNPFEFDYAGFCRFNNLFYQQSCSSRDIRLYAANEPTAMPFIEKSHDWCMAQLAKYIPDPKTKGLIQAMLLGDEVNLDEDLRQSYSETGIIHIIAISGGNVAIFFVVITWLLWWLRHKKHLWIKYAVALPLVWFYVLMAGAPPSAVRAALMFSLLAFSVILQKNNNSLNQLCATAFLLLCAQPAWLFSVGFQLSFVAVLSLILFYRPVYKLLSPKHKVTKFLWSAVAASTSAEVLVAPLVIYYFHTFPLLFVVANAAAYLFMGIVLVLGIVIIALFFIPAAAKCIGIVTVWLVTAFDKIVTFLQSCNPVSFHFLLLYGPELMVAYIVIAGLLLFLLQKQKPALFTALCASCLLMVSFCRNEWQRQRQLRLVLYNTGKANQIELIKGNRYQVLATDTTTPKKTDYATIPVHTGWQAWQKDSSPATEIFEINGKTILLLNREIDTGTHFHVDYLIINYTGKTDPAGLKRIFSPKLIITGNNYTRKQQEKWASEAVKAGVAIHATAKDGAFVLE